MKKMLPALLGCLLVGSLGCLFRPPTEVITWADLVRQLANPERIARLDVPSSALISSSGQAGGNDDYNNFLRPSQTPGWVVLADLKGPGYLSRFWFTGAQGEHPLRFYFDDESTPRISTTLQDYCGKQEPGRPPLADYANYCWFSFIPLPYKKRLIIETQAGGQQPGGWPRIFYQINYSSLPRGQPVQSFPGQLSSSDLDCVQQVRQAWKASLCDRPRANAMALQTNGLISAGATINFFKLSGPALLKTIRIQPDLTKIASPLAREQSLRDLVLRMRWNDSARASVEVPLGDFFGCAWQRLRFQTMYFGMTNDTLINALPMPFEKAAELSLQNQGHQTIPFKAAIEIEPLPTWDAGWGYLHSGWQRTTPADVGQPHPVLRVKGRGKYVGCLMSVVSLDRSYWIMEGNESISKDDEKTPGWRGTGLEDYFNGGWYYQNVMAGPLHGLIFKAPFRTVQYNFHLPNPVLFKSALEMLVERGPADASRGWMESTAFYYLEQPAAAFTRLQTPSQRQPPQDRPLAAATLMNELWNYERFDDHQGASEYIDRYLEQFPQSSCADILRLRQLAYQERQKGFDAVRPEYERIAATQTNTSLGQLANLLLWCQQSPSNALLGAYANTRSKIFLDGHEIGESGNPEQMMIWKLQVGPGKHVLAIQSWWKEYPEWTQLLLRTQHADIATSLTWKHALNPAPGWQELDYDDGAWATLNTPVKGPPEEPYIWVMPDPFIDMQSKALGLRNELAWPDHRGTVVFRHVFELP